MVYIFAKCICTKPNFQFQFLSHRKCCVLFLEISFSCAFSDGFSKSFSESIFWMLIFRLKYPSFCCHIDIIHFSTWMRFFFFPLVDSVKIIHELILLYHKLGQFTERMSNKICENSTLNSPELFKSSMCVCELSLHSIGFIYLISPHCGWNPMITFSIAAGCR